MLNTEIQIEATWKLQLADEFQKSYFKNLIDFLAQEKAENRIFFPKIVQIFNAYNFTPFDDVKVVIIGQDPYHGPGQAHGLSFSVPDNIALPPSLNNIYKELYTDLGVQPKRSGNLEHWAQQGVFLLNAVLTVRAGAPTSHSKIGWQTFTDAVIKSLSDNKKGLVFLLWGNYARSKKDLIDSSKHFILEAAHPSPLARGAFFGCRHFSKTNELLKNQGLSEIIW